MRLWIAPREFNSLRSPHFHWEVAKLVRRLTLNQIMRRFESSPPSHLFFHAGVVQRIRIPGYEPGDLEVQILPPAPFPGPSSKGQGTALRRLEFRFDPGRAGQIFTERRPTGEVPGCLPGLRRVRFSYAPPKFAAMWTSWLSHPSFKRVIAGSNPAIATISMA